MSGRAWKRSARGQGRSRGRREAFPTGWGAVSSLSKPFRRNPHLLTTSVIAFMQRRRLFRAECCAHPAARTSLFDHEGRPVWRTRRRSLFAESMRYNRRRSREGAAYFSRATMQRRSGPGRALNPSRASSGFRWIELACHRWPRSRATSRSRKRRSTSTTTASRPAPTRPSSRSRFSAPSTSGREARASSDARAFVRGRASPRGEGSGVTVFGAVQALVSDRPGLRLSQGARRAPGWIKR